jgi:hypothetical protein
MLGSTNRGDARTSIGYVTGDNRQINEDKFDGGTR